VALWGWLSPAPRLLWGFCAVAQKPARSVCAETLFIFICFLLFKKFASQNFLKSPHIKIKK
jgi:hypothetical protein